VAICAGKRGAPANAAARAIYFDRDADLPLYLLMIRREGAARRFKR
jgi:hypothetical protein